MIKQGTSAWHAQRKGRLTASIAGAALGLAPYMTPQDARDTINGVRKFEGNIATDYGTRNEPVAIAEFEQMHGVKVEPMPFVPFEDWSGGSPDGLVVRKYLIEVKCPYGLRNDINFDNVKPISKQMHYYAQMQLCMHFTWHKLCKFITYLPQAGVIVEDVNYDPEWIAENLPVLKQFYDDAISEPSAELKRLVDDYLLQKHEMETLKTAMSDTLDQIVEAANGKPCRIGEHKLTLTKRKGSISYAKAIKELVPSADLEKFRGNGSESWGVR